ncbi:trace amine-associated receptor 7b-like [Clytia hemisphaerica]|uniref:trace amine-associated receptor 7b-like n=1 Tax=Clytia hemisphaerica TaxID=252671 RepID=UPI0034D4541B
MEFSLVRPMFSETKNRTKPDIIRGSLVLTRPLRGSENSLNETSLRIQHEVVSIAYQTQALIAMILITSLFLFLVKNKKCLKRHSTKLFMNMQVAHFWMAITIIVTQHTYGNITPIVNNGFLLGLFLGMLLATMDRYVQIHSPMTYQHLRSSHVIGVITCSWVLVAIFDSTILSVARFQISQRFFTSLTTILLLVTYMVLIFTNASVLLVAKRHQENIRSLYKASDVETLKKQKHSLKATKTCVTIVASYLLLWLPFLVHNILSLTDLYQPDGRKLFSQLAEISALSNAIVDQILFVAFHREVKKTVGKCLRGGSGDWDYGSNRTCSTSQNRKITPPSVSASRTNSKPTQTVLEAIKEED